MKIIIHHKIKDSGLGNYARAFVDRLTAFFPNDELTAYQNANHPTAYDVFHSLDHYIPKDIERSKMLKVITIEDMDWYYSASWWKKKWMLHQYKKSVRKANIVITHSEQSKKLIVELLKVHQDDVKLIYPFNVLENHQKYTEQDIFEIRHRYQLPERFILNVLEIKKQNNLFNIVKALKETDIPLVLVGKKTAYAKKISRFVRKNGMENRLLFVENIQDEDVALLYQLADMLVHPSLSSGKGMAIVQALQAKTVVVTSNRYGLSEFGGDNSMYVCPHSVHDIKSKITFLWENPSEGQRRVEKSEKHIAQFQNKHLATQIMEVYANKK